MRLVASGVLGDDVISDVLRTLEINGDAGIRRAMTARAYARRLLHGLQEPRLRGRTG